MKWLRVLLIVVAIAGFGVAASYPILYHRAQVSNDQAMESLAEMRSRARGTLDIAPDEGLDIDFTLTEEAPEAAPAEVREAAEATSRAEAREAAPAAALPDAPESAANPDLPVPEAPEFPLEAAPETVDGAPGRAYVPAEDAAAQPSGAPADALTRQEAGEAPADTALPVAEAQPDVPAEAPMAALPDASLDEPAAGLPGMPDAQGEPAGREIPPATGEPMTSAIEPQAEPGAMVVPGEAEALAPSEAIAPDETEAQAAQTLEHAAPAPTPTPGLMELILDGVPGATPEPDATRAPAQAAQAAPTPEPTPEIDRLARMGPVAYPNKEKVPFDESKILPELKEIYAINHDLVGWLTIPDTNIDHPVLQAEDGDFYLKHDFYGERNYNGQLILDYNCDPYTPSYNLVISGHHMRSGKMFGYLPEYYRTEKAWKKHRFVEFDTLMNRRQYVVFAAFYSADYDVNEKGFRYTVNVEYRKDAEQWLGEIKKYQLYDTGIDVEFGDEFLTLTTCTQERRSDGRFVVVCRRIRKGETFE